MNEKEWGPGAPKVPLRADEAWRAAKCDRRRTRGLRRHEKWVESRAAYETKPFEARRARKRRRQA